MAAINPVNPVNPEVLLFENILYFLRRALENLYEESDQLEEIDRYDDEAHEQSVKAKKRFF